ILLWTLKSGPTSLWKSCLVIPLVKPTTIPKVRQLMADKVARKTETKSCRKRSRVTTRERRWRVTKAWKKRLDWNRPGTTRSNGQKPRVTTLAQRTTNPRTTNLGRTTLTGYGNKPRITTPNRSAPRVMTWQLTAAKWTAPS
ncbi:hypothetical protein RUND412_011432, partial [Rhizina undulata]